MITSAHSPHVERVKALLGPRGNKERRETNLFVAEGLQPVRSAIRSNQITTQTIYVTDHGRQLLAMEDLISENFEFISVSESVAAAMADTVTPQGIVAICEIPKRNFQDFIGSDLSSFCAPYFWQIQDPGNAGTVIRSADAFGCTAVFFSKGSVDIYSPKVVRATAGSLWNIPIYEDVAPESLLQRSDTRLFITEGTGDISLASAITGQGKRSIWIFGNEARGAADLPNALRANAKSVVIPMLGQAESLNVASAASIVMYSASLTS